MSERRLTEDVLTSLFLASLDDDRAETTTTIRPVTLRRLITELRDLRGLLATPMPCGWPVPEHIELETMPPQHCVRWESLDAGLQGIDPDEAIALGAVLIRAALQAKGGAK